MGKLADLKSLARFKVWAPFRHNKFPSYNLSHSQFGEDMVVRSLFWNKPAGTYVDIGAHHPVFFSNTYHFYCLGWRGLNVDATPGSMAAFRLLRPGDTNIEACVSADEGKVFNFYLFTQGTLNTTDAQLAADYEKRLGQKIIGQQTVRGVPLQKLLETHMQGRPIDILNIDVEGMDEEILDSNDWTRYRPQAVIFERAGVTIDQLGSDKLLNRMRERGYRFYGKCGPSFIVARDGCTGTF